MKPFNIAALARENILLLEPYTAARNEYSGTAALLLDANENTIGSAAGKNYNRYPDPLQQELKQVLSGIKNTAPEQIFIGNGSDEAIDILLRIFCRPGKDNIIVCPPTYGMYRVAADINDVAVRVAPLTQNFDLDTAAIQNAADGNTKIIFICTPGNPTGNNVSAKKLETIIAGFNGIVAVDEAYIDFSDPLSFTGQLHKYPNLVVLQTLSKAWGMAALRLGMAFASAEIITLMNKVKPPYNIGTASQQLAIHALARPEITAAAISNIRQQRMYMQQRLSAFAFITRVYPSDANFLLVQCTDALAIYNHLLLHSIVVRRRDTLPGCAQCLRITVGTPAENEQLYKALETFTG